MYKAQAQILLLHIGNLVHKSSARGQSRIARGAASPPVEFYKSLPRIKMSGRMRRCRPWVRFTWPSDPDYFETGSSCLLATCYGYRYVKSGSGGGDRGETAQRLKDSRARVSSLSASRPVAGSQYATCRVSLQRVTGYILTRTSRTSDDFPEHEETRACPA